MSKILALNDNIYSLNNTIIFTVWQLSHVTGCTKKKTPPSGSDAQGTHV